MAGLYSELGEDDLNQRINRIRIAMANAKLAAFLIPRTDAHRSENVADCDNRLQRMTGFSGSAGLCVMASQCAALFVDGRYKVQAEREVDDAYFQLLELNRKDVADWIIGSIGTGEVGYDPWLHTKSEIEWMQRRLDNSAIKLRPTANLVEQNWHDRPDPPRTTLFEYEEKHAGESSDVKIGRIVDLMRAERAESAVLTLLDSIAWLLNIRASDIPCTPVARAFAIMNLEGIVSVYLELPREIPDPVRNRILFKPQSDFLGDLDTAGKQVLVDPDTAPMQVFLRLDELNVSAIEKPDPCILAKATKNRIEIAAVKAAHRRDGAAVVDFLAWHDSESSQRFVSELDLIAKLEGFRESIDDFRGPAFDTIAATGPNAAIVHYRATPATSRTLSDGDLVLIDSGGQFLGGTTDVTRTIAVGLPEPEQRRCFTLVLKGLIALSRARWPKGRSGLHLDSLARYHLWQAGLDFDHGTGHGVGHFLSVHEGPQGISPRSGCQLLPGMIVSIEPGYYRTGHFGIRLENLAVVQQADPVDGGDERTMLEFKNLTWIPIERALIVPEMLTPEEKDWVDDYHRQTLEQIWDLCAGSTRTWLELACRPLH